MVIEVKEVPIKAYNSIRKVERYYILLVVDSIYRPTRSP